MRQEEIDIRNALASLETLTKTRELALAISYIETGLLWLDKATRRSEREAVSAAALGAVQFGAMAQDQTTNQNALHVQDDEDGLRDRDAARLARHVRTAVFVDPTGAR